MRRQSPSKRRWTGGLSATLVGVIALLCLCAGMAQAEKAADGKVIVNVNGGIFPAKLPRSSRSPIQVLMESGITTTDKSVPPELKEILLDINSHGVLQTQGLPTCSLSELEAVSRQTALNVCGGALIGHGNVSTHISLPSQEAFASNGLMDAFNARLGGHQAILAQVTSEHPLPLTFVIRFEVKKGGGQFGTDLVGTVPPIASGYGEITGIDLSLSRNYTLHGKKMSVLSANCPAPKG
ncbi:MAG: hypothetical protein WB507_01150, partial [Solirubrobacterales bacterium]